MLEAFWRRVGPDCAVAPDAQRRRPPDELDLPPQRLHANVWPVRAQPTGEIAGAR